jgi:hypothetical protein
MLNAGFVLLGRTRALVDDFGEIIYVADLPWCIGVAQFK